MSKIDYGPLSDLPGAVPKPSRVERVKAPKPRKAVVKVNSVRRGERRAVAFGEQAAACRQLPCAVCAEKPPSEPHHHPTRAAGGTDADTVPLCSACHHRAHQQGAVTFWTEAGLDPEDVKHGVREWIAAGKPAARVG